MTVVLPDTEIVAVEWARENPALIAIINKRCATRLPKDPVFPFLTVFRVTGAIDESEAPIDLPLLQWDCYGAARGDSSPDYETASLLARTLVAELEEARGQIGSFGVIMGTSIVQGPRRVNEPETGWARYEVESMMMVRNI